MNTLIELLKSLLFGIVEGVTEWLDISSPAHLILRSGLVSMKVSEEFCTMLELVSQLGPLPAFIVLLCHTLHPSTHSQYQGQYKQQTYIRLTVSL